MDRRRSRHWIRAESGRLMRELSLTVLCGRMPRTQNITLSFRLVCRRAIEGLLASLEMLSSSLEDAGA